MTSLKGRICIVTGASKGIGRGIALQLGSHGATVYITGRSADKLQSCAEEINQRGGTGVPVILDHSNDSEVEAFFERIKSESHGRLDVLVNNAYAGVDLVFKSFKSKSNFYDMDPVKQWDCINGVGLRNHFLCSVYAARMMVGRKDGLIVNVSSYGGIKYVFNASYGIGKAACDRMAADCAHELKKDNVTFVSLWPGPVKTELVQEHFLDDSQPLGDEQKEFSEAWMKIGESMEFAGMAVAHLAQDPNKLSKTGKILLTGDLGVEYGFQDLDGSSKDMRSLSFLAKSYGYNFLSYLIPSFVRIPLFVFHMGSNKF